jgi:integrase
MSLCHLPFQLCPVFPGLPFIILGPITAGQRVRQGLRAHFLHWEFPTNPLRVELHRNAVTVNGQTIVGTLKSGKDRTVVLPQLVVDALAVTAQGRGRDQLLWASRTGGYLKPPGTESWLASAVSRCQAADPTFPRITAHDLRHTAASLAISAGANPKVVQRMLGHASAAMTLDVYADLFESDLDAVADRLEDVLTSCSQRAQ